MDNKNNNHEDHNYYRQDAGDNNDDNNDNHLQERQQSSEHLSMDVASSPSNSTSSRRRSRVVELLMDNHENNVDQHSVGDWIIGPDFYDEDVAQNSDNLSEDDDDFENDIYDVNWNNEDDHNNGINNNEFENEEDSEDNDNNVENEYEEESDADDDDDDGGFVFAPNEEDEYESVEDTDSDDDDEVNQPANYDTTLPVAHHYLGDNLEESRGREVLIEGSIITLPLFNLSYVVLFPGQVLPLKTFSLNPRVQMYLRNCVSRGTTTIGLMWSPSENRIGTTAEITSYGQDEDEDELKLLLKGRQRFRLISQPFETAIDGQIEILPEIILGKPQLNTTRQMLKFLPTSQLQRKYLVTRHPDWVMKKYEAHNLIYQIMEEIKDWCELVDVSKDPIDFSYWLAANLPISNQERMEALKFSCVEARLVWLLDKLEKSKFFGCSNCKNLICYKKDVFPMSRSGPQCSFVNPNGYVHDTLTVRHAQGIINASHVWSSQCSWFPGYVWQIIHCDTCQCHLGWRYKRTSDDMKPKTFFGFSRASIRLQRWIVAPENSNNQNQNLNSDRIHNALLYRINFDMNALEQYRRDRQNN